MLLNPRFLNLQRIYSAALRRALGVITHVATDQNVIALTFDDGPHPDSTPQLLEILNTHKARATFFMLGVSARRHPLLVRQAARAGHAVCNHSWDHPSFAYITPRERREQIRECRSALSPNAQRLFRPPYGDLTLRAALDVRLTRHRAVTWNVASNDWIAHDAQWYRDHLSERISPGSIVLLHDTLYQTAGAAADADRSMVLEGIDLLLQRLKAAYRFVTVPELLRCGRPQKRLWSRTSDIGWLNSLRQEDGMPRQYDVETGHAR